MTITLTADTTAPFLLTTSPAVNSNSLVGTVQSITVTFNEPMNPVTFGAGALQLVSAGADLILGTGDDVAIPAAISYNANSNAALLALNTALQAGKYRVQLAAALTDVTGNPLAGALIWDFEVGRTINWIASSDGYWDVGANWSTGSPPQDLDIVIIDVPGNITVTHRTGMSRALSLQSQESLVVSGSTLTLGESSITSSLSISGGGAFMLHHDMTVNNTVNLGEGTLDGPGALHLPVGSTLNVVGGNNYVNTLLEVAGSFNWTGGALRGSGITRIQQNVSVSISGSNITFGGALLENAGTMVLSS
ncbi:MAG: Ig-like domain-containing protein [Chloroflexi bacterium]|nr:Ig-like domain-containing protein [Chloroflexota bacterium]